MAVLRFDARMFRAPATVAAGPVTRLRGISLAALSIDQRILCVPFARSIEEAMQLLDRQPRCHVEPDGSFVWRAAERKGRLLVEGQLQDREGRLLFAHLRGACDSEEFLLLRNCLTDESEHCVWELTREGIFLDDGEFLRYAAVES